MPAQHHGAGGLDGPLLDQTGGGQAKGKPPSVSIGANTCRRGTGGGARTGAENSTTKIARSREMSTSPFHHHLGGCRRGLNEVSRQQRRSTSPDQQPVQAMPARQWHCHWRRKPLHAPPPRAAIGLGGEGHQVRKAETAPPDRSKHLDEAANTGAPSSRLRLDSSRWPSGPVPARPAVGPGVAQKVVTAPAASTPAGSLSILDRVEKAGDRGN